MENPYPKKLIINMDDVGLSAAVNNAAMECLQEKAVMGISLLACGRYFDEAVSMLESIGSKEAGVHLALTGGFLPCDGIDGEVGTLLDNEGKFPPGYKEFCGRYFMNKVSREHVIKEFSCQIDKVKRTSLFITHIDAHEHIHMLPGIAGIVADLARENGIKFIRWSREPITVLGKKFSFLRLAGYAALRLAAVRAGRLLLSSETRINGRFYGHFHSGRIDNGVLSHFIRNLTPGVNELAVHLATRDDDFLKAYPWYVNGPAELETILHGKWRKLAEKEEVQFITHREAVG